MIMKLTTAKSFLLYGGILLLVAATTTTAYAQIQNMTAAASSTSTTTYESIEDGIRFAVPEGWVVQPVGQGARSATGALVLAHACPEAQSRPAIGGQPDCLAADIRLDFAKQPNLDKKPEFANVYQGRIGDITVDDYIAFTILDTERNFAADNPYRDQPKTRIENSVDHPVTVSFTDGMNTTTTTPGKIFDMVASFGTPGPTANNRMLLTMINEGGQSITGFKIQHVYISTEAPSGHTLRAIQEIFDSFQIIALPPTPPTTPTTT